MTSTIKISQLPSESSPSTADLIPLVKSATLTTEQTPLSNILALIATATNGWTALPYTPTTVTYNGNRSYSLVFNATDLTGTVSNGMRLRLTRSVTAPTQCTSLNGSTQYYSKSSPAGMTFTNNFVVSAWVKLTSYAGTDMTIASRYNGTSGWELRASATTAQIQMVGRNAGASNQSNVLSYRSIPLNKWVHVTAQLDMSTFTAAPTTSYVMIDGVDVPCSVSRTGTNPTALVQAGNLEIGSENSGTSPFPGKIAQVAIFNAKVTQATMQSYISQGLLGTETSLISAYSFNNSINDLNTTNANNLTANGSAVATNVDAPWTQDDTGTPSGTTDFGIITSKVFSTNTTLTVRVPGGCTIPTSGGVSAVSYSTQKTPYAFPGMQDAFSEILIMASFSNTTIAGVDIPGATTTITIPTNKCIKITAYGQVLKSGTSGDIITLNLYEDAVIRQNYLLNMAGSNFISVANLITPNFKPIAGSHTYKLNISSNAAGTMQFNGTTSNPAFLRVDVVDL